MTRIVESASAAADKASIAIALADSAAALVAIAPVMCELRTHLSAEQCVLRMQVLQQEGYQLAYAQQQQMVVAVAGFRVLENLSWGRYLMVFDLGPVNTN